MKLSYLAKECGGKLIGEDTEISALCTDSRVAGEGDLFFCLRGTKLDSHVYAAEAERRGAAALVSEKKTDTELPFILVKDGREAMAQIGAAFYGHPEREMRIVGVTGTNGKTTVSHMLFEIFKAAGIPSGLIGTLGARYGEITLAPALTTPDPVFLFSLLSDMRKAGVKAVAMEVSAHALALKKESPILYETAIFTNLTQDHLDFFKTMDRYAEAKKSLFTPARCRLAVLNSDDPFSGSLFQGGMEAVTYGMDNPADCFALVEREDAKGSRAMFNLEDELCEVTVPLVGRFNISNALAAAATAKRMGIGGEDIAEGLSRCRVEGRLEHVATYRGAEIFVDFAHTPDGLKKSLSALRPYAEGRLLLVFGCGGDRDRKKRPVMGEIAAKGCDFAVITSDNPRYEDPCAIISEIEAGFRPISDSYVAVEEREKGIAYALSKLGEGDILLVAGKGGEHTQEIMGIKYDYNDKTVIESLMGK